MKPARPSTQPLVWQRWTPLVLLLAALPAMAQYKVIGPDGKVTYTDRAPTTSQGKVSELSGRGGTSGPIDVALPLELRQPAARYPVTLYASSSNCDPCESARQLLRQRGIPYVEKSVQSTEDAEALERLTGGRDSPTLAIGSQMLRGLAPEVWNSYLDAAGYPRDSRLPASYQYAAATPLVERQVARPQPAQAQVPTPAAPASPQPGAAGIKF